LGQKVNPHGIRLGIVKDWDARWYADKDFAQNLHEDIKIRDYLKKSLQTAGVPRVETERSKNRLKLTIHTAKPGMVIGRGGSCIESLLLCGESPAFDGAPLPCGGMLPRVEGEGERLSPLAYADRCHDKILRSCFAYGKQARRCDILYLTTE